MAARAGLLGFRRPRWRAGPGLVGRHRAFGWLPANGRQGAMPQPCIELTLRDAHPAGRRCTQAVDRLLVGELEGTLRLGLAAEMPVPVPEPDRNDLTGFRSRLDEPAVIPLREALRPATCRKILGGAQSHGALWWGVEPAPRPGSPHRRSWSSTNAIYAVETASDSAWRWRVLALSPAHRPFMPGGPERPLPLTPPSRSSPGCAACPRPCRARRPCDRPAAAAAPRAAAATARRSARACGSRASLRCS